MAADSSGFVAQAGASLAGSLAGALAAFQLEAWRQRRRERRSRIDKMNRAIFSLGMRRNYLVNLNTQQLEPNRKDPLRAFLPPVLRSPLASSIEWTELTFLLNPPGQGDLLNRFALGDEIFRTVVGLVEKRIEIHSRFQEQFALWEREHRNIDVELSFDLIRHAVGPTLTIQLRDVTDHLYESVDRALAANREVYSLMTLSFARLFPNETHARVEEIAAKQEA